MHINEMTRWPDHGNGLGGLGQVQRIKHDTVP